MANSIIPGSGTTGTSNLSNINNLDLMERIAQDTHSYADVQALTSSRVTDQLKVFLIAQARNELIRIIKLTKFLDKLESQFIGKVETEMLNDSLTLKQYNDIVEITVALLARSNDIISKVLKDDSLTMIMNTTIYQDTGTVSSTTTTSSIVASLKDAQSRERVRLAIQKILSNTETTIIQEGDNNGTE